MLVFLVSQGTESGIDYYQSTLFKYQKCLKCTVNKEIQSLMFTPHYTSNQDKWVEALMAMAKKLEGDGETGSAERLYRKAVATSEVFYGNSSPRTGLAVLELMSFCENHNYDAEVANLWNWLRIIFAEQAKNTEMATLERPKFKTDCK